MAEIQHYVPQFLLRQFGNAKEQVFVFNKRTGKVFQTHARNIAAEKNFYDFNIKGSDVTLEKSLGELEGKTQEILRVIIEKQSLGQLKRKHRTLLSSFIATQLVRTRATRNIMQELGNSLAAEFLRRAAGDAEQLKAVDDFIGPPIDENRRAMEHARLISKASVEFAPMIREKTWWLGRTTKQNPFVIGDHPIGLQNSLMRMMHPDSPRGTLGLRSPGVEIYLPLSPTLTLIMVDDAVTDRLLQAARVIPRIHAPEVHELRTAIKKGTPVEMNPANVDNMNSLQIIGSESFVFASTDDFVLAKLIVEENPGVVDGPRFVIG